MENYDRKLLIMIPFIFTFFFTVYGFQSDLFMSPSHASKNATIINAISDFISQGNYYRDIIQDKNKAIGWYDKALAIDPYNAIALAEKGVALSNLYNFSGATECN